MLATISISISSSSPKLYTFISKIPTTMQEPLSPTTKQESTVATKPQDDPVDKHERRWAKTIWFLGGVLNETLGYMLVNQALKQALDRPKERDELYLLASLLIILAIHSVFCSLGGRAILYQSHIQMDLWKGNEVHEALPGLFPAGNIYLYSNYCGFSILWLHLIVDSSVACSFACSFACRDAAPISNQMRITS